MGECSPSVNASIDVDVRRLLERLRSPDNTLLIFSSTKTRLGHGGGWPARDGRRRDPSESKSKEEENKWGRQDTRAILVEKYGFKNLDDT